MMQSEEIKGPLTTRHLSEINQGVYDNKIKYNGTSSLKAVAVIIKRHLKNID